MSGINLQLKTATELFHGGRLAEAAALCEALAADGEASSQFRGLLGQLQLLRNRTDAAEPLLVAALAEAPESPRLRGLLAETYRRAGRLLEAAGLYRNLGRPALTAKLEATGGDSYRLTPPAARARGSSACCCNRFGWSIGSAFASAACSVTASWTAAACGSTSPACALPSQARTPPESDRGGQRRTGTTARLQKPIPATTYGERQETGRPYPR